MNMSEIVVKWVLAPLGMTVALSVLAFLCLMAARARHIYAFQSRIKAARRGENYHVFRSSFADQSISETVLRSVYQTLSSDIVLVHDFPVRALDSLKGIYGIDGFSGTEMNELVEVIAMRCGLNLDLPPALLSLETVADLIALLGTCSRTSCEYEYRPVLVPGQGNRLASIGRTDFN
jgi:hypothetical protein